MQIAKAKLENLKEKPTIISRIHLLQQIQLPYIVRTHERAYQFYFPLLLFVKQGEFMLFFSVISFLELAFQVNVRINLLISSKKIFFLP